MKFQILAIAMLAAFVPLGGASSEIGSGHILAGDLIGATMFVGVSGVDGFELDISNVAPGTVLSTVTTDNSGSGYDLDMQFYDSSFNDLGGCFSSGTEETCEVPEGAAYLDVIAFQGVDLNVSVVAA